LLITTQVWSQEKSKWKIKTFGGINFGAPIGKLENATGSPAVGPYAGVGWSLQPNDKIYFVFNALYSFKGGKYAQDVDKDTTIKTTIFGQEGFVDTYFNAKTQGNINFHYLEFPISLYFNIFPKINVGLGFYGAYLFAGRDYGTVAITVGDGSIESFNTLVEFDNFKEKNTRRLDYGLNLNLEYNIFKNLNFDFILSKGLPSIYQKGFFSRNGFEEVKVSNHFVRIGLNYNFNL
jgi:hypothetical protein